MKKNVIIFLFTFSFSLSISAQNVETNTVSKQNDPKMQWWKEAKFGMFIHWGLYSVPAGKWGENTNYGEWIMNNNKIPVAEYAQLATKFNPVKFNADEWVKIAKDAGQKYIVITAKHHDGFAMFGSKASTFNIVDATPFKRDVIKELAEACRKQNMKLGLYYSQAQDWHHTGGAVSGKDWDETHIGDMATYIDNIAIPQVKEILENYSDVAVLWWDTPIGMTKDMSQKLADIVKKYPNLITNNRLGAGMGGDLETPEQFIPATGFPGRNWEVCMTMNGYWGYNAYDDRWKSTTELIQKLIDIVSKGGNFLLNVGPNQYGIIPEVCQKNLREIGDWLKINGESIYGTQGSPFPFLSYGRATRKGQTIYIQVFEWPKNGKLIVPLGNKIKKAYLLADTKNSIKITSEKDQSILQLLNYAPDKIASVIALEIEGEPIVNSIPSAGKKVIVSSSSDATKIITLTDSSPNAGWSAAKDEKTATLEIELDKTTSVQCLALAEPWHPWDKVTQNIELQYLQGTEWKTIFKTKTNGLGLTQSFNPVVAQKFRILLENPSQEPALNEIILLE
jgi:alpha-L-fucosidase